MFRNVFMGTLIGIVYDFIVFRNELTKIRVEYKYTYI
jgi:hypothetical protein